MRKFFLKNYTQNVVEELSPDPFLINQNWVYLWINSLKFHRVCFYCMSSWGLSRYIKTKLQITCFYLIKPFFRKTKSGRKIASLPHFLHDFWGKMFLLLYSIKWPNFIVWFLLLLEMLGNMCIVIHEVINFEINLTFLIKPFFLHDKKVKTKI